MSRTSGITGQEDDLEGRVDKERHKKTTPIYDCRCDERLKPKDDEST
jgi:hypothetical protein